MALRFSASNKGNSRRVHAGEKDWPLVTNRSCRIQVFVPLSSESFSIASERFLKFP